MRITGGIYPALEFPAPIPETSEMNEPVESLPLRRTVYTLLIVVAAAIAAARILSVTRLPMATFADNDRSRWDTVRALVDNGTYAIGERLSEKGPDGKLVDRGIITEKDYETIDKVLHPETHQFFSSKPPLLATIAASEYWLLKHLLGWSITENRWQVIPTILLTVNWLPLVVYLFLLARLVEHFGATDWGRLFVLTAGCFATILTGFMNTFNNHTVATCSALFALYAFFRIWCDCERRPDLYFATGFFAGFTAANELPAVAFVVALFLMLLRRTPWRALLLFVPGAMVPLAAFFLTNYLAVGQWKPAYSEFGGPWYEFEGSFWAIAPGETKHGIDWAYQTENSLTYAFHVLAGHHGIFSLSPIYLLTVAGAVGSLYLGRRRTADQAEAPRGGAIKPRSGVRGIALLTLILSAVVIGFYIFGVNERNRNYGGWTNGLRWLMWLIPLWLLSMLPAADWLSARRWGRGLACILLAVSVFSANYVSQNPWRHPWLYDLMESRGWINY